MNQSNKAVALVSGGMDSLVVLAIALKENTEIYALHMQYEQKTVDREKKSFFDICDHYGISDNNRLVFTHPVIGYIGGSSLTDKNIPVSQANLCSQEIPSSYVPFRNAHLLCMAVSWSEVLRASKVYIGAVEEDSSGYPDCRETFYRIFNNLVDVGTKPDTNIDIITPVIHWKKKDIVLKGDELRVPFNLTWSCYKNSDFPCNECDSCALRARGFAQAGIVDPLVR